MGLPVKGKQLVNKSRLVDLVLGNVAHDNADNGCPGFLKFFHNRLIRISLGMTGMNEQNNTIHLASQGCCLRIEKWWSVNDDFVIFSVKLTQDAAHFW